MHTNVVGVDVSNEMVQYARNKFTSVNNFVENKNKKKNSVPKHKLSFTHLDISQEIPSTKLTRKFSKIFSFYCLHWIRDQGVALHNIHRLLEADGEALLVFLAKNPIFDAYRRQAKKPEWSQYMQVIK